MLNTDIQTMLNAMMRNPLFIVMIVWVGFWKGLALWHASGRNQSWWFIAFLVLNTLGVIEMIYLFIILRLTFNQLFRRHKGLTDTHQ